MKIIKKKIIIKKDKRGVVFNPLQQAGLAVQKNVHIVITSPGYIRGNHYHKKSTENLIIYGSALLRIKNKGEIDDIIVKEDEALSITIPPGIAHAIKNTGTKSNLLIAFQSEKYQIYHSDTFQDILIENNDE